METIRTFGTGVDLAWMGRVAGMLEGRLWELRVQLDQVRAGRAIDLSGRLVDRVEDARLSALAYATRIGWMR